MSSFGLLTQLAVQAGLFEFLELVVAHHALEPHPSHHLVAELWASAIGNAKAMVGISERENVSGSGFQERRDILIFLDDA
jgi:hypothetical protein